MRAAGALADPSVATGAHACWCFDTDAEFVAAAAEFLGEGARRHERLLYVADRDARSMRSDVAGLDHVDELLDGGQLFLQPVGSMYEPDGRLDVDRQVAAYRTLVDDARRDGYSGLRVAADATVLVTDAEARRRFVRYELTVDQVMATEPMTALCGYKRRVVGDGVAELAAVHPLHHGIGDTDPRFRAYFADGALRLVGELDLSTSDLLAAVLEVLRDGPAVVVLDLSDLEFVDCDSLARLAQLPSLLQGSGREVRVRAASDTIRRCSQLLGFDCLVPGAEA